MHRETVEKLYDERFVRMWEFYLAGSEMAFRKQGMMVFQLQLAKRQDVVPRTRDYIVLASTRLRAVDHRRNRRASLRAQITTCGNSSSGKAGTRLSLCR